MFAMGQGVLLDKGSTQLNKTLSLLWALSEVGNRRVQVTDAAWQVHGWEGEYGNMGAQILGTLSSLDWGENQGRLPGGGGSPSFIVKTVQKNWLQGEPWKEQPW